MKKILVLIYTGLLTIYFLIIPLITSDYMLNLLGHKGSLIAAISIGIAYSFLGIFGIFGMLIFRNKMSYENIKEKRNSYAIKYETVLIVSYYFLMQSFINILKLDFFGVLIPLTGLFMLIYYLQKNKKELLHTDISTYIDEFPGVLKIQFKILIFILNKIRNIFK